MKKTKIYADKPLVTLGQLVGLQFDAMDRDLSHITPRNIRVYNQIVAMTAILPKKEERR